tara:strand:- start:281 stop:496 length:216 start_codon:yes stop_codon:yes gene_type:complete
MGKEYTEEENNVIEFYNKEVWILGMRKSKDLTNQDLMEMKNSLWFSKWMLCNKYNECVNSIKNIIQRHGTN